MNNSGDSLNRSLTGLRERRDSEYNNEIFRNRSLKAVLQLADNSGNPVDVQSAISGKRLERAIQGPIT